MARSRNIKPAFFLNDCLADIHPLGRLLFIGLWTIADFKGCLAYSPRKIKAQVLPYDDCDIEALMINLEQARFIRKYVNCGNTYIKITAFEAHQNPHKNERDSGSDIPDFDEKFNEINELEQDGTKPEKIGSTRADSLFLIPDSIDSVAKATAASGSKSPEDLTKVEIWATGREMLISQGMPKSQCGSFLGKLFKTYDPGLLLDAVRTAAIERPADVASYLTATCQHLAGRRKPPNKQQALEDRNDAVLAEFLKEKGLTHAA